MSRVFVADKVDGNGRFPHHSPPPSIRFSKDHESSEYYPLLCYTFLNYIKIKGKNDGKYNIYYVSP